MKTETNTEIENNKETQTNPAKKQRLITDFTKKGEKEESEPEPNSEPDMQEEPETDNTEEEEVERKVEIVLETYMELDLRYYIMDEKMIKKALRARNSFLKEK